MKPPYDITPKILKFISAISEKLGAVQADHLNKQTPQLRKKNRVKTIHASLQIEGNTLTEEQITALIDQKKVIGPKKDVLEVLNAIKVYEALDSYQCTSEAHFLKAHRELMTGLIADAGKYRNKAVGIVKGTNVEHIAPPHQHVPHLMKDLFAYLQHADDLTLIKSCVFHYEVEFIHPFIDGNGRMGRLWQTLILMNEYPIFDFLPFETLISDTQEEYYKSLALSDKTGKSTIFIEYMLQVIDQSLEKLLDYNQHVLKDTDRIEHFLTLRFNEFTRKDYMAVFKNISTATASRDLKKGIALNYWESSGSMNKTRYKVK
jgi:Fic family protein